MSLAIDVDKVPDVLLADGWHTVKFGGVANPALSSMITCTSATVTAKEVPRK